MTDSGNHHYVNYCRPKAGDDDDDDDEYDDDDDDDEDKINQMLFYR